MTINILAGILLLICNVISTIYHYKRQKYKDAIIAALCSGLIIGILLMLI